MAFDVKFFPLKDCGKTNPHLSSLFLGRIPRPAQFWVVYPDLFSSQIASVSGSSTSESEDDTLQPNPREQPGGVTNNHSSSILMETLGLVRWWSCSRSCEWNERCRHGYHSINPLSEQRLLPIPSDLTKSSNVDEIVEIDVKSKCLSLRSLPRKTSQTILLSLLSNTNSTLPSSKTLWNISKEDLFTNKEQILCKKWRFPFRV